VFGIWYGKGPGVDRCSTCSSTPTWRARPARRRDRHRRRRPHQQEQHGAHQSDHIFKACGTPVFFPSSVQDILDMGLHAFAMSRFSGVWSGMKTIQEVVESSASVSVDPDRVKIILPEDFAMPPGGLHIRWPDAPLEQEARLMDYKWYAALAYVRANKLNYNVIEGPHDRFGIIASGKAYNDTRQALADLGLDDDTCRQLGIRCTRSTWCGRWRPPSRASSPRAAGDPGGRGKAPGHRIPAQGRAVQLAPTCAPTCWASSTSPGDHGRRMELPNPSQNWLLRQGRPDAGHHRQGHRQAPEEAGRAHRRASSARRARAMLELKTDTGERTPWFCSGCPHNTSTRVPEGSRAVAGIGCHYMVWTDRTSTFTQMGGEGVPWVGQAPFTQDKHVFANLGDGTYFHSGLLAIRQSIARREHHLQDPLQRRRGHDRRPAGGRAARGPFGAADHEQPAAEGVEAVIVTDEPQNTTACRAAA
jgi:indolepyruvate ferredoxin oxidoreductase